METIIKTKDLCKSYFAGKNEIEVLKNINLEINKGDFTVIMGSSGSGKSTLLYSISTMDEPTSGTVELLGNDITRLSEKQANKIRSSSISFVFQSFNLLNDITVAENITIDCPFRFISVNRFNTSLPDDEFNAPVGSSPKIISGELIKALCQCDSLLLPT